LTSTTERKTSVEEENKRKIAQFQMYVMNRVNKSQEELRKFQAEQTASFKRLVDDINTFKDNTTKVTLLNEQKTE
jgi:TRAP-type mannitol/chloroaromatic compound transport system substrate-binding protein